MAEEDIEQALGEYLQEQDENVNTETEQAPETPEAEVDNGIPEDLSDVEQEAWQDGWRPKDQFEGNPDNWKPAIKYIAHGIAMQETAALKAEQRRKEQEFEERFANLNRYHEAKTKAEIEALEAKQLVAVEEGDTAEFNRLKKQIATHQESISDDQPVQPQKDPVIQQWEERNPWIFDKSNEKSVIADAAFAFEKSKGASNEEAVRSVEEKISRLYPQENPRRNMPNITETGKKPPRGKARELTMGDLTHEERQSWNQFGSSMYSSEREFLKAVQDARKS